MSPEEIRAAVAAAPALQAFLGATAGDSDIAGLAAALSLNRTKVVSHFASERGILDRYPLGPVAADALMGKLEAFATTQHPLAGVVRRAVKFLGTPEGIDLGSNGVQTMLSALTPDVLTTVERDGLRSMATVPVALTPSEVQAALFDDLGNPR